jgi:hypothetical protein
MANGMLGTARLEAEEMRNHKSMIERMEAEELESDN